MPKRDLYGYAGQILDIDLKNDSIKLSPLDKTFASENLGGKGFGAKILFDQLPLKCPPLSPENILIFATGPLTGTLTPTSGRCVVCTKSPATGLWLDANCGGTFGPELKMAGIDVVIIRGRAPEPVMIIIDDSKINIKKAVGLWGKDTFATHNWIKKNFGRDFRVACIGVAGEKEVRLANIISEQRAFGRGGAGAVMGSKNLKAIAVRGTQSISVADPESFMLTCREAYNELGNSPDTGGGRPKYGTNAILSITNRTGVHPVRNFQKGKFRGAPLVNEETIEKFYVRNKACFGCPIYCSKIAEVKDGFYKGSITEGPDYENVWSFGANCENTDIGAIILAEYLCDLYGLDTISTGNVIGFLMECVEKSMLSEADIGFKLQFGVAENIIQAIHVIGNKKGPGALWGEGVRRIAQKIDGAEKFAIHVKGLELPAYDPRGSTGMALAYATSDRGGCHVRAFPFADEYLSNVNRLDPFSAEFKPELVKSQQDYINAINSCVICLFSAFALNLDQITPFLQSVTGLESFSSGENIMKLGERISTIIRLFNLREGLTSEQDSLPRRFFEEPLKEGPLKGRVVDLDPMIKEYYFVRGWDKEGKPTRKKLKELDLLSGGHDV